MHAIRERGKTWPSTIEGHRLAVEKHVVVVLTQPTELGITRRHVVAAAGIQSHPTGTHVGEDAHPVPLDFVDPLGPGGDPLG